ncbi:MAG TPA: hypothetical protein VNF73_00355 [Candidatus Saccharimonadales bacterium]|nr:hypothetical protein [Candidatus Saccharimonadales bacterium]
MAERKPFLLRLDPDTMAALRAWAADDLRSLNGQIEFLLRRALRDAGRASSNAARRRDGSPNQDIDDTEDGEPTLAALSEGRGDG